MITPNCKSETKIDIHAYSEQNYLRSRNSKTRNHFTGDGDADGDNIYDRYYYATHWNRAYLCHGKIFSLGSNNSNFCEAKEVQYRKVCGKYSIVRVKYKYRLQILFLYIAL